MKRTATTRAIVIVVTVAAASCVVWSAQTGTKLVMDGRTISEDVRVLGGTPYVRVSDVAKALGMALQQKGAVYQLTPVGGGHQIRGVLGALNASIFNGTWVLKVAGAQKVKSYTPRYGRDRDPLTPKEVGDTLVVVRCQIRNGTDATRDVSFDTYRAGNTALTDDEEHAYFPLAYDSRNSDHSSARVLPGSAHDFAVIFSVPEGARLNDLIYTVLSSSADFGGGERDKGKDFRISLGS